MNSCSYHLRKFITQTSPDMFSQLHKKTENCIIWSLQQQKKSTITKQCWRQLFREKKKINNKNKQKSIKFCHLLKSGSSLVKHYTQCMKSFPRQLHGCMSFQEKRLLAHIKGNISKTHLKNMVVLQKNEKYINKHCRSNHSHYLFFDIRINITLADWQNQEEVGETWAKLFLHNNRLGWAGCNTFTISFCYRSSTFVYIILSRKYKIWFQSQNCS